MYKRIMCPVDGSKSSNYALSEAIQLAKDQNASLLLLHVIDLYVPIVNPMGMNEYNFPLIMDETLRKNGQRVLKKADAMVKRAGITAELKMAEVIGARVSQSILEEAKTWSADLIIMGTHGLRGVARLVMGSDAESVVRSSTTPVLLLRSRQSAKATPRLFN